MAGRALAVLAAAGGAALAGAARGGCPRELAGAPPVVVENCAFQGADPSEWDVNGAGDPEIVGFAERFGYAPGETVALKVRTPSDRWRADVYRLGWYGGKGARLVASVRPDITLPQVQPECERDESTLLVDCGNWAVSARFALAPNATSGVYVARLTREDDLPARPEGAAWRTDYSQLGKDPKFARKEADVAPYIAEELEHSYGALKRQHSRNGQTGGLRNALREPRASHVYFVVRDLNSTSDLIFQLADTTWQAYNRFGGSCTYGSYRPAAPAPRSYVGSYNRPFENRDYRSINLIFGAEYPAIRFLERNGYDVSYQSAIDTHVHGSRLLQHKVFMSVGHDEYWSAQQRKYVEAARDAGVHLMFWSGNQMFWKVRWENSTVSPATGEPRTMVCYKETQELEKKDPREDMWTGTFRDSRSINPEGTDPENSVSGQLFTVNAWRNDPLIVPRRFSLLRLWENTKVASLFSQEPFMASDAVLYPGNQPLIGQRGYEPWAVLKQGLLGHEWDEDVDNGFRPHGMIRMSETQVDNVMYIQDSGSLYDTSSAVHHLTLYRAPGLATKQEQAEQSCQRSPGQGHHSANEGALVFGAGTVQWTWGLDPMHDNANGLIDQEQNSYDSRLGIDLRGPDRAVQQATVNTFAMMGAFPFALEHGLVPGRSIPPATPADFAGSQCIVTRERGHEDGDDDSILVEIAGVRNSVVIAGAEVELGGRWRAASADLAWYAERGEDPAFGRRWRLAHPLARDATVARCRFTNNDIRLSPVSYEQRL